MWGRPFCNKNWTNGMDLQIIHPELLTGAKDQSIESRKQGIDPWSLPPQDELQSLRNMFCKFAAIIILHGLDSTPAPLVCFLCRIC